MSRGARRPPRAGRLLRFLLEVAFLGGLAALAALARLQTVAVIGVMAFGWVVVALAEWAAWLDRPHYGRGLPPRYVIPQMLLPSPLVVEQTVLQAPLRFPSEDEEETRIALAGSWPSAFEEWPSIDVERLGAAGEGDSGEETGIALQPAPQIEEAPQPTLVVAPLPPDPRPARHRVDPFTPARQPSRWRGRASGSVEVPARPPDDRPPPRSVEEDPP